jgi:hypothetical protein
MAPNDITDCSIVDSDNPSVVGNLILKYQKGCHYAFRAHYISLHSSARISTVSQPPQTPFTLVNAVNKICFGWIFCRFVGLSSVSTAMCPI